MSSHVPSKWPYRGRIHSSQRERERHPMKSHVKSAHGRRETAEKVSTSPLKRYLSATKVKVQRGQSLPYGLPAVLPRRAQSAVVPKSKPISNKSGRSTSPNKSGRSTSSGAAFGEIFAIRRSATTALIRDGFSVYFFGRGAGRSCVFCSSPYFWISTSTVLPSQQTAQTLPLGFEPNARYGAHLFSSHLFTIR